MYDTALGWLRTASLSGPLYAPLKEAICEAFGVNEEELLSNLAGVKRAPVLSIREQAKAKTSDEEFEEIIPDSGFLYRYKEYTKLIESPMSYNIFSALAVCGAALGRRVFLDMEFFKVWPNFCVVLTGPTGLVAKTTAVDIATDIVRDCCLCPILADQLTPSMMMSELSKKGGHHFIYAPELSNFLDKEKFNEALITRLIRLLDCPEEYVVATQMRQEELITNVALTILAGTTPDQMITSMPKQVISSGFMNRFLWVMEMDTDRDFPLASKGPFEIEIKRAVKRLETFKGKFGWSGGVPQGKAYQRYDNWYRLRRATLRKIEDETVRSAIQRGKVHILKMAMLLSLVEYDSMEFEEKAIEIAEKLLAYSENRLTGLVKSVGSTKVTQDSEFVMEVLRRANGVLDHSTLLRRVAYRGMNSSRLATQIATLVECGLVSLKMAGAAKIYTLMEGALNAKAESISSGEIRG